MAHVTIRDSKIETSNPHYRTLKLSIPRYYWIVTSLPTWSWILCDFLIHCIYSLSRVFLLKPRKVTQCILYLNVIQTKKKKKKREEKFKAPLTFHREIWGIRHKKYLIQAAWPYLNQLYIWHGICAFLNGWKPPAPKVYMIFSCFCRSWAIISEFISCMQPSVSLFTGINGRLICFFLDVVPLGVWMCIYTNQKKREYDRILEGNI